MGRFEGEPPHGTRQGIRLLKPHPPLDELSALYWYRTCTRIGALRSPAARWDGFPLVEKEIVSAEKVKPVRDEQTLAQLLEAAYVLQEHNREMLEMELRLDLKPDQLEQYLPGNDRLEAGKSSIPTSPPVTPQTPGANADYASTLAEIVSTQHQIQVRHLELDDAMSLVAERLTQIARASGAVVGLLHGKRVRYRAMFGLTLPAGTEVPMEKALCFACLQTSQVFRCADVHHEERLDTEECRWRGIQSLIAVPIFQDGEVAGGLELYYPNPRAFTEHDVHTCQLMAGLVAEALARDQEVTLKKSLASERAVMLEALEKLKPNLAALVDGSAAKDAALKPAAAPPPNAASTPGFACRKCSHQLVGEEQFCGNCGTPRSGDYEAPSMQSKVASLASLWHMQEAMKKSAPTPLPPAPPVMDESAHVEPGAHPDLVSFEKSLAPSLEKDEPEFLAAAGLPHDQKIESTPVGEPRVSADFEDSVFSDFEIPLASSPAENDEAKSPESTALAPPARATAWSSAATAREFLEQLASPRGPGAMARLWNTHRGDIYLAIAVILVAGVICWGVWSTHTVGATGNAAAAANHHKPAPDAGLSLFDRMLVSLGLAEPPEVPEYKGNPATQVWVDLHTALYYCPGADLYGKTPKGKFASQRDAQLDQFEPASRKACD